MTSVVLTVAVPLSTLMAVVLPSPSVLLRPVSQAGFSLMAKVPSPSAS